MDIRTASILDVKDISRIHASSWKTAYKGIISQEYLDNLRDDFWVPAFEKWISEDAVTVKLAYEKDKPVGCIAYGKSRDTSLPDWGEIVSLYVLPEHFGDGFGTALLTSAVNDLDRMGFKKVFLWVLEENLKAQKFYHRNGFLRTEDKLSCEISGKKYFDYRLIHRA